MYSNLGSQHTILRYFHKACFQTYCNRAGPVFGEKSSNEKFDINRSGRNSWIKSKLPHFHPMANKLLKAFEENCLHCKKKSMVHVQ